MLRPRQQMQRHALKARRILLMLHRQHALAAITHRINLFALYHNCADGTTPSSSICTPDASPCTSDDFPKSSKVGAFLSEPPLFLKKISVLGHQKSRKGTNPIRPNDTIPSLFLVRSSIFVYVAPYSDAPSVHVYKHNHPSFVSEPGWLNGQAVRNPSEFSTFYLKTGNSLTSLSPLPNTLFFVPSLVGDSPFLSPSPLILFVVLAVTLWSSYSSNSKRLRLTISLEWFCPIPRTHSSLGFRLA